SEGNADGAHDALADFWRVLVQHHERLLHFRQRQAHLMAVELNEAAAGWRRLDLAHRTTRPAPIVGRCSVIKCCQIRPNEGSVDVHTDPDANRREISNWWRSVHNRRRCVVRGRWCVVCGWWWCVIDRRRRNDDARRDPEPDPTMRAVPPM